MSELRVLSLGAGVQSTTVLLMSLAGELPRLDAAIFADTGWEPTAVYAHLVRLEAEAARAGLPVYRVSAGDLRNDALDPSHRFASMPLYVATPRGKGKMRRQCTREYKITPIHRHLNQLRQQTGAARVEQWFGISLDEPTRLRTPHVGWITNAYPLVGLRTWLDGHGRNRRGRVGDFPDARPLTRAGCHAWLTAHGWPQVPRSACCGCPFRTDAEWRHLRDTDPDGWADAVAFDHAIRNGHPTPPDRPRLRGQAFLHASLTPLEQVDLTTPADHGQGALAFAEECEGMCGL